LTEAESAHGRPASARSRRFVEDVLAAKQFYGSVFGLPGRKMIGLGALDRARADEAGVNTNRKKSLRWLRIQCAG
jgi:hypothetical protein